jgi:hypothetical protein
MLDLGLDLGLGLDLDVGWGLFSKPNESRAIDVQSTCELRVSCM